MSTAQEKDSILKIVYDNYVKYGIADLPEGLFQPYADYSSIREKSGMDENSFLITFEELEKAHLLGRLNDSNGGQYPVYVEISPVGFYFYGEKGGYTAIERRKENKRRKKVNDRAWELANKVATLLVAIAGVIATFYAAKNASNTDDNSNAIITHQKSMIDSLSNHIDTLERRLNAKPITQAKSN